MEAIPLGDRNIYKYLFTSKHNNIVVYRRK